MSLYSSILDILGNLRKFSHGKIVSHPTGLSILKCLYCKQAFLETHSHTRNKKTKTPMIFCLLDFLGFSLIQWGKVALSGRGRGKSRKLKSIIKGSVKGMELSVLSMESFFLRSLFQWSRDTIGERNLSFLAVFG